MSYIPIAWFSVDRQLTVFTPVWFARAKRFRKCDPSDAPPRERNKISSVPLSDLALWCSAARINISSAIAREHQTMSALRTTARRSQDKFQDYLSKDELKLNSERKAASKQVSHFADAQFVRCIPAIWPVVRVFLTHVVIISIALGHPIARNRRREALPNLWWSVSGIQSSRLEVWCWNCYSKFAFVGSKHKTILCRTCHCCLVTASSSKLPGFV